TEATTEAVPSNDFAPAANLDANGSGIVAAAAVDSLNYREVGFIFEFNGKTVRKSTKTVYASVEESDFTAEELGGKYMYAFNISDIDAAYFGENIKVTPFAVTLKGKEVLGESREYSVDSLSQLKTMSVYGENTDSVCGAIAAIADEEKKTQSGNDDAPEIIVDYIFVSDETVSGSAITIGQGV
ncbi:MAG: hypothetical protein IJR45_06010, partial [Firmicutes bacterium]|nr:hypothetical protein [Bacillota bacterium]